jgi:hypothetical protein
MTATTITTKVVVVEDEEKNRAKLERMLQRQPIGFDVRAPRSLEGTINQLLLERSDGGMFDIRLDRWGIGKSKPAFRVNGLEIRNGIDIANFFREINEDAPVGFHSSYLGDEDVREEIGRLRFKPYEIPKPPPPDIKEFESELKDFRRDMINANKSNPLVSVTAQKYRTLTPNEQFRLYKMAFKRNRRWIDTMIKVWGDFTWVALLDGEVYWAGNGHKLRRVAGLKIRERYPTEAEIKGVAAKATNPFFIFWNTKADMLDKVFKQAGPWLANIPACARSFFGLSVARALADLYLAGERQKALTWCAELDDIGKLEVAKSVFKLLRKSKSAVQRFERDFAEEGLPVVAEVFKAEVMKIEGRHTAWVELRKWGGGRAVPEPFDLGRLQRCGVKYKDQMFEYTVYEGMRGDVATNVEPTVAHEGDPFYHPPERGAEE